MTSIGIGRFVPLAAALALAGAHPALAQDRMVEGTWTGTVYPPDGEVVPLEYAVAYGEEGLVIELIPPPEVAESVLATQVLHDGETLTFTIEVVNVVCTLYEEEEDGRYEGECVDESGDGALMVMFPPGDPSRSGG